MNGWILMIVLSALALGVYDVCKKASVRDNAVMPALFFATCCGTSLLVTAQAFSGNLLPALGCTAGQWGLILLKSLLVASSWICVYYAMRDLPISIAAPIRSSSPLWTFLGGMVLYHEIPNLRSGLGMLAIFAGYYGFSLLGKLEGISFRRSRGIHLIFLGTLLGAASALYDKYLMGVLQISADTVQIWFSIDLVAVLGLAWLIRSLCFGQHHAFQWRWAIPATGILLILADWLYFHALHLPDARISEISLVRRSSCVVTFLAGSLWFHDRNLKRKAAALALILAGVILLALR